MNLTEAVEYYLGVAGIEESDGIKKAMLLRAKVVWYDIRNNILRIPKSFWVPVEKRIKPYRAIVPKCLDKFYTIGAKNKCDEFVPFSVDESMLTEDYKETKCNCSPLDCLQTETTTKELITFTSDDYTPIPETEYYKTTIHKVCGKDAKVITETPYISYSGKYQVQFELGMWILENTKTTYSDSKTQFDTPNIHNNQESDIHYFNGMYSESGGSYWGNSGISDMFRCQFIQNDIGVSNHSNFGVNEIAGHQASTSQAYTSWNNNLIQFIKKQLENKDYRVYNISFAANGITTGVDYIIKRTLVTMEIDFVPSYILMNDLSTYEWNLELGTPYAGWDASKITQKDNIHKFGIIHPYIIDAEILFDKKCEVICEDLETKECGCTKISESNLQAISENCTGDLVSKCTKICNDYFRQPKTGYVSFSESGYFKFDQGKGIVFLAGDIPDSVLISGQTASDTEEEEEIPAYCLEAFIMGMDYFNSRYSPTLTPVEKRQRSVDYIQAKLKLEMEVPRNKILISTWDNQTINFTHKW